MQDCLVSVFVSCTKVPLITFLASIPCLGQLLSGSTITHDSCEVNKSTDTQPGVVEIGNGLWYLSDVRDTHECEVYSRSDFIIDTIIISVDTLIKTPCDKRVVCCGNLLSSASCENTPALIFPTSWNGVQKDETFQIPMTNLKNRLIATCKARRIVSYQAVLQDFTNSRSFLQNSINQIGYTIVSIILFIVSAAVLYVLIYEDECSNRLGQSLWDCPSHTIAIDRPENIYLFTFWINLFHCTCMPTQSHSFFLRRFWNNLIVWMKSKFTGEIKGNNRCRERGILSRKFSLARRSFSQFESWWSLFLLLLGISNVDGGENATRRKNKVFLVRCSPPYTSCFSAIV